MASRGLTKSSEKQLVADFKEFTGVGSTTEATKWLKKYKYDLMGAVNGYFAGGGGSGSGGGSGGSSANRKKIGEIWEQFKNTSDPNRNLITIDGTMRLSAELGIDPESDVVLFCLATDLGSKSVGEFAKEPFVDGWLAINPSIDSIAAMKAALPGLRKKLNTDPVYFKSVYMHTFDLTKKEGARVLDLETALGMWQLFIPPALAAQPSALSHVPPAKDGQDQPPASAPATDTPSQLGERGFELWLQFQQERGKAVSKDTWSLFIDFVRTIDAKFQDHDETAAWPSTIDDFVEYARERVK